VEVSALKHTGVAGPHGRSPLLRLQSDERLVALIRRGNHHAFEAMMARYQSRLLAFCRHMLGSREDAEDVLQEVFAAAFNAIQADERPINVRPWLYRIARNRSLNHLRRVQAIGVDSMDVHFSENGATTADKVHKREEFRLLLHDVRDLPETQRTALLLREIDALSYDQIAEAMDTTVPSVKSLLVRARVALAEAAEARQLSCEQVRLELGEAAEGLKRVGPPVRRHVKQCDRCADFKRQLKATNKALAAVFPVGPLLLIKKLVTVNLGGSAAGGGAGAGAGAAGTAAGTGAGAAAAGAGGLLSAGAGAVASKTAAGLAAAAIVGVGAVEVRHVAAPEPTRPRPVAEARHVFPVATGGTAAPAPPAQPRALAAAALKPRPKTKALPAKPAAPAPAATAKPVTAAQPVRRPTETVTDTTVLPGQPAHPPASHQPAGHPQASPGQPGTPPAQRSDPTPPPQAPPADPPPQDNGAGAPPPSPPPGETQPPLTTTPPPAVPPA
jgi:RNA polymerase sigma factor (sigma-70 family)